LNEGKIFRWETERKGSKRKTFISVNAKQNGKSAAKKENPFSNISE
jgi:hypothetical protein